MPAPPTGTRKSAVVLLSGGLDSAVTLYLARQEGHSLYALSFDYGQRHDRELESARGLARAVGAHWERVRISLPWGGSALTDEGIDVPAPRPAHEMSRRVPSTYVPARNTIFLGFAVSWAEVVGAEAIYIGANAIDYSGYPDCRPEYFERFQEVIRAGTREGVEGRAPVIRAPLVRMSKADIVSYGCRLGVPFERTWSCYRGHEDPCQNCESCLLRAEGFKKAGVPDPLLELKGAGRA